AFAADTIDEAFKTGTVSGSLTAYALEHDGKGGLSDETSGFATINLGYETATYKGFSAKAAFEAGHAIDDATLANDALMTEAYIRYANDMFSLTVGRQAIDLEWLGDYNEAVVAGITAIPDTTIVLGYVNQQAAADEDEIGDFTDLGVTDGAYVVDAKYTGFDGVELNPYFYSAVDVADFYGLKATYTSDMFGLVAQYAASSEDFGPDGSIGNVELSTSIAGVSAAVGYIKTDDTAGVGSIATYGDNITPFDNGDDNYAIDAETTYGSLGYTIAGVELGALYGETDFVANSESSELNLMAGYSFSDSLSLGLLYVDYDLEGSSASDYKEYSATLAYTF
uniref:Opr family porin n=1 Tax=Poseidonibacter antarcticus TaxID=2478538 RepID=UPI000EF4890F